MCRRHHTHKKPNRRRRRRQHPKRTRPGRPSTARSSHVLGRPVQSVVQRQATPAIAACAGGVPVPACLSAGATSRCAVNPSRRRQPSAAATRRAPRPDFPYVQTRPAAAFAHPANQSAGCTLAALDFAGGLAPGPAPVSSPAAVMFTPTAVSCAGAITPTESQTDAGANTPSPQDPGGPPRLAALHTLRAALPHHCRHRPNNRSPAPMPAHIRGT